MNWNYLFIISGILWAVELIPQILKTYRTKKTDDICIWFPFICSISFFLFFVGCIGIKNWVLLFSHIVPFIGNVIFLILVIYYQKKKDMKKKYYCKEKMLCQARKL